MTEKQFQRKLKKMQKEGERYKQIKEVADTYAEYFPQKKEKKTSTIMLIVAVTAVLGYVVAALWLQLVSGIEVSPTITTLWFTFWTVEIWQLARIKVNKDKHVQNTFTSEFIDGDGING